MCARGFEGQEEETSRLREQHVQRHLGMEEQGGCRVRNLGVCGRNGAMRKVEQLDQSLTVNAKVLDLLP